MQTSPYMRRHIPWPWPGCPGTRFGPGLTSKTGLGLEREHQKRVLGGPADDLWAPEASRWLLGRVQTAPRAFREVSRRPQECSKRLQEGSKTALRALQEASRAPPRALQGGLRRFRRSQDLSKSTPRGLTDKKT